MTLRRRFALILGLQTVAIVLVVAAVLFLVLGRFLRADETRRLEAAVPLIDLHVGHDDKELLEYRRGFPSDVHVRVVHDGVVVAVSPDFPDVPVELVRGSSVRAQHQLLVRDVREDDETFTLQLATDLLGVREPLRAYLRALALVVPLAALVVALLSGAVAGRMLEPLRKLERAALAVDSHQHLRDRLPGTEAKDELGSLARTLQGAFGRLAAALEREQEFTRAAAHDLRAPLTALLARLQSSLARPRDAASYLATLRELERDVVRLARLTEQLLLLAQEDGALSMAPIDLVDLAGTTVDHARERYPSATIDLDSAGRASAIVLGDETLLSHLLENLIENAVVHGGGAPVTVSVAALGADVRLRVADTGPGVDPAIVARLGEPFYQPDAARRAGSGLGLAIVRRVAGLHAAGVRIESAPGDGFRVTVSFPSAAPSSGRRQTSPDA